MQLASQELEPTSSSERSPLAAARIQRKLTVDEVARRADLPVEQVEWLEEGRIYRFPSADHAIVAVLLYAAALGIDGREARGLAGLAVPPKERFPLGRVLAAGATAALLALLAITVFPGVHHRARTHAATLPPPWRVSVDVLNGSGDINATRALATRIGALGYRIERVAKANRFDYPQTAVYYEPGGAAVGQRLANQLHVPVRPLPGGRNPLRVVVIAGPPTVG
jgi:transcriptional regulator with XRE-family HTH domain